MFRWDFRKKGACSKSVYKNALSKQVFGKWMHFHISLSLWELQVIRGWFCIRDTAETFLNRLLLLLILKNSHRSCSVEKVVLKNITEKHLCWGLFLIKGLQRRSFPLKFAKFLRAFIFKNTCIFMQLYLQCMKKIQLTRCN